VLPIWVRVRNHVPVAHGVVQVALEEGREGGLSGERIKVRRERLESRHVNGHGQESKKQRNKGAKQGERIAHLNQKRTSLV